MKFFSVFAAVFLLAVTARAEHLTIGLAIPQGVTDGGAMAAAAELGLFKAENLEPEFIVFQGAGALLPQVATKQINIGLPLTEPVLASYQPGNAPLPVVFFYNASPYNGMELAVLADGPVQGIADLKGKAIGVGAMTWGTLPQTRSLLRNNGLHPGSDVDIVAVGILGAGFNALRTGRVAALNYNENWIDTLEEQGTKVRRLTFPPAYRRMISNAFVAQQDTLRDHPDLLARFGRVVTEAGCSCATPIRAFASMPSGARIRNPNRRRAIPARCLPMPSPPSPNPPARQLDDEAGHKRHFGEFDLGIIRDYVKAMAQSGEFASSDVPLEKLVQQCAGAGLRQIRPCRADRARARGALTTLAAGIRLLEASGASLTYQTRRGSIVALDGVDLAVARRFRLADRQFRLRQVLAVEIVRGAVAADRGKNSRGRHRGHRPEPPHRHRLPASHADAVENRAAKRAGARRGRGTQPGREPAPRRGAHCPSSASRHSRTTIRTNSPAACSSASASRACSCTNPRCCCWTNRSPRSTHSPAKGLMVELQRLWLAEAAHRAVRHPQHRRGRLLCPTASGDVAAPRPHRRRYRIDFPRPRPLSLLKRNLRRAHRRNPPRPRTAGGRE